MRPLVFCLLAPVLFLLQANPVSAEEKPVLVIASASNFRFVLEEIISTLPFPAKASYASTGKLSTQIQNGAPFDIFMSARSVDDHPELSRLITAQTMYSFNFAQGYLVAWSPKVPISALTQTLHESTRELKVAYANPKLARYGLAAQRSLAGMGIDPQQHLILKAESVSQVFQFAQRKVVDLAFVALSHIQGATLRRNLKVKTDHLKTISLAEADQLVHSVFLLKRGELNPLAKEFLNFLRSDQANATFEQYGYTSMHAKQGKAK